MTILLQFPQLVEHYAPHFESLFSEAGYRYFRRYLSGLLVSENKTLEAINRLFVLEPRNQSSFNRFVNRQNFDIAALHRRRIDLMQQQAATAFKSSPGCTGVLILDDTLLSHYGSHFDQIYWLYNYVKKNYGYLHNLVTLHYSDDQTDYPLNHQLWLPPDWEAVAAKMRDLGIHVNGDKWNNRKEQHAKWTAYISHRYRDYQFKQPALQQVYKTKIHWALEMLRTFRRDYPHVDLPLAIDSGYTSGDVCQILDKELKMTYVGSLKETQHVILAEGEQITLADFKNRLLEQHHKGDTRFLKTTIDYKGEKKTYYAYCATHRIKGFAQRQRLVISFKNAEFKDSPRFSITNRMSWFASPILRVRRHRWPVETFHQEGKDEGLDKYQVRHLEAIQTHIAFVSVAYSMLKAAIHDPVLMSEFRRRLDIEPNGSLPTLRRFTQIEAIALLIEFVVLKLQQGQSEQAILKDLFQSALY